MTSMAARDTMTFVVDRRGIEKSPDWAPIRGPDPVPIDSHGTSKPVNFTLKIGNGAQGMRGNLITTDRTFKSCLRNQTRSKNVEFSVS